MLNKGSYIGIFILSLLMIKAVSAEESATQPVAQQEKSALAVDDTKERGAGVSEQRKLQANIALHTLAELQRLLTQAEKIAKNASSHDQHHAHAPIFVVLHGEEIKAFVRSNYRNNKALVDLAARLDAFNVIDVKVCAQWMGTHGILAKQLPPFVEPVPLGSAERTRLEKAGYAYF